MSLSQPEDRVAALSCCPLAVIVMHPLTQNPNYNSVKPCECMDLCCIYVCVRERETEQERKCVQKERKKRGR